MLQVVVKPGSIPGSLSHQQTAFPNPTLPAALLWEMDRALYSAPPTHSEKQHPFYKAEEDGVHRLKLFKIKSSSQQQ